MIVDTSSISGNFLALDYEGDSVEYSLIVKPAGISIDSINGSLTLSPGKIEYRRYTLQVQAQDEHGLTGSTIHNLYIGDTTQFYISLSDSVINLGSVPVNSDSTDSSLIELVVSTNGDNALCFYWLGAVARTDTSDYTGPAKAVGARNYSGNNAGFTDFTSDGSVGLDDLSLLAENWGCSNSENDYDPLFDIDNDGEIGLSDLTRMADLWGQTAGKASLRKGTGENSGALIDADMMKMGEREFELNINIEAGNPIRGYQFTVTYDPERYELLSLNQHQVLNKGESSPFRMQKQIPGAVYLAQVLDAEYSAEAGTAAVLRFRLTGSGSNEIEISDGMIADMHGGYNSLDNITLTETFVAPKGFCVYQNYPNPFNPETTIKYELPSDETVAVAVYDLTGQMIRILYKGKQKSGLHTIKWNGRNETGVMVSSGMYIYRIKTEQQSVSRKMILLK